jgi:hypothetical protein
MNLCDIRVTLNIEWLRLQDFGRRRLWFETIEEKNENSVHLTHRCAKYYLTKTTLKQLITFIPHKSL